MKRKRKKKPLKRNLNIWHRSWRGRVPNHSLEATANFLQGSPLGSCWLTAATRRMALFNLDLAWKRGKKNKKSGDRFVSSGLYYRAPPPVVPQAHCVVTQLSQLATEDHADVVSQGARLPLWECGVFFLFMCQKMLLGASCCISEILRLLTIYIA